MWLDIPCKSVKPDEDFSDKLLIRFSVIYIDNFFVDGRNFRDVTHGSTIFNGFSEQIRRVFTVGAYDSWKIDNIVLVDDEGEFSLDNKKNV